MLHAQVWDSKLVPFVLREAREAVAERLDQHPLRELFPRLGLGVSDVAPPQAGDLTGAFAGLGSIPLLILELA